MEMFLMKKGDPMKFRGQKSKNEEPKKCTINESCIKAQSYENLQISEAANRASCRNAQPFAMPIR